jgi:ribulose-phosphate 3-epimerase
MTEIIPAVLAENFSELNEKLSKFVNVADIVQIDICDGKFVPSVSWPMGRRDAGSVEDILNEENGLPYWEDLNFEFDLMVLNAHKQFDFFARLGAKRIVFHLEAETEKDPEGKSTSNGAGFKEFLESMDPYFKDNIEIGIAINTNTDIAKLDPFINLVDFVQTMGIEKIGFQGEPFDEKVLGQIKNLKKKYPELTITVDGSVNENTARALIEAGASRLVVGSALLNSFDIRETFKEFENM